jgi:F420-0:gamma-glutamyl ligase
MHIIPIKTNLVNPEDNLAENFLAAVVSAGISITEKSIIVVSSKVFSYAENRILEVSNDEEFQRIVEREAEMYYSGKVVDLTYKQGLFVANAGIDKSNIPAGKIILWPENPQKSVDEFRLILMQKLNLKELGVIMIDSICLPGRNGVTGAAMAYSGIVAVTDERGKADIYGNPLRITKVNKADAISAAANLLMGESNEMIPYCLVSDLEIEFTSDSIDSVKELAIPLEDCIFNAVYKF